MFTIQSMFIHLCILKLYHARPCAHARLCMLFLTKAAAKLTHALLHPQPSGPFCKVGYEQTLVLKRLADIFEGATRQKSKNVIPPTKRVENVGPPKCKMQFHLRGWKTQQHNKDQHNKPNYHT
jgi:hypothetical protein